MTCCYSFSASAVHKEKHASKQPRQEPSEVSDSSSELWSALILSPDLNDTLNLARILGCMPHSHCQLQLADILHHARPVDSD